MKSGAVPALPRVFARSRRRLWLELAALALLRASATAGSVLFVRAAFAALADSPESALAPTAALAGCLAADALGEAWERTAAERLGQHYVGETRSRLFAHLVDVEPRELAERGAGAVLLRLVGDLTPLRQWIAQGVVRVAVAGTVAAAALGALAWSAPALALAVGAAFALGGVATLACAGRLERSSERMRRTRGALANHLWSMGGGGARPDVDATFLQPFVSYGTPTGWTFGANLETTYDWTGSQWTVPVNVSASKVTRIGGQLVSIGGGLKYWAEGPPAAPEGLALRATFTLLFPK